MSLDTVVSSEIDHARLVQATYVIPCVSVAILALPPPSAILHVPRRLQSDRGIARGWGKRRGLLFGRLQCTGRASGALWEGQVRVPAPRPASQGFFFHPSFYVKVGVIVLRLKTHVTFAQHMSLW